MWQKKIKITYVDGEVIECTSFKWPTVRSEGVDRIDLGCTQLAGDSIYFLYRDTILTGSDSLEVEDVWVAGAFSIFSDKAHECILRKDGGCIGRTIRAMPDLNRDDIKIGWWRKLDGSNNPNPN
jgi:hypothetical protein